MELARWLLECRGIDYRFLPEAAGLSAIRSSLNRVPIELPLLKTRTGAIGGLRPSFQYLSGPLLEAGREDSLSFDRAFVSELFDGLFSQAVRTFYWHMLEAPAVLKPLATNGVPAWHRAVILHAFGAWRAVMHRGLNLDDYAPEAVRLEIASCFRRVAEAVPPGASFLRGSSPGTEDVVFAVLASPVVLPKGHPVRLPAAEQLPAAFGALVTELRETPAGKLAQRVYEHR